MKSIYQAALLLLVITLIAGFLYPLITTGIGRLIWAEKSNGSLIKSGDKIIGSELIAQQFSNAKYFWPRPSASNFSTLPSGASNLGPTSLALAKEIAKRRAELSMANGIAEADIPIDLVTASASGLDPHISVEAAQMQVKRIINARGLDEEGRVKVENLIMAHLENRQFLMLGEKRINVLLLNLELDRTNF